MRTGATSAATFAPDGPLPGAGGRSWRAASAVARACRTDATPPRRARRAPARPARRRTPAPDRASSRPTASATSPWTSRTSTSAVLVKFMGEITGKNFVMDERVQGKVTVDLADQDHARGGVPGLPGGAAGEGLHHRPERRGRSASSRRRTPRRPASARSRTAADAPSEEYVTRLIPLEPGRCRRHRHGAAAAGLEGRPHHRRTRRPTR